jgi:hypothetical protein
MSMEEGIVFYVRAKPRQGLGPTSLRTGKEKKMERSLIKSGVRGEHIGLHFVNPDGASIFLFASQILAMWESPEDCILIKDRDLDGKSVSGYPVGQVIGALDLDGKDARVLLFLGTSEADIETDDNNGGLKNVESSQVHCLPLEDMDTCVAFFKLMRRNRATFDELEQVKRTFPLFGR